MIVASIDIGTNTVLLLLADVDISTGKFTPVKNLYKMPRIGKGLIRGGVITEEKIDSLISILSSYKKEAELSNAEVIILTATNALRIAKNGEEVAERVKKNLGLDIRIISGEEEAYLSYLGASSVIKTSSQKLVIDIGGGSTEIIIGENHNIIFRKSFQIGVVSLTEKFISNNPPASEDISEMGGYIDDVFSELGKFSKSILNAVAVAGTPTTLSCIHQNIKDYDDSKVEGYVLSASALKELSDEISAKNNAEIRHAYGSVVEGREDVLLSGTLILRSICDWLNLSGVTVSSKGLRYGALMNYLNKGV